MQFVEQKSTGILRKTNHLQGFHINVIFNGTTFIDVKVLKF